MDDVVSKVRRCSSCRPAWWCGHPPRSRRAVEVSAATGRSAIAFGRPGVASVACAAAEIAGTPRCQRAPVDGTDVSLPVDQVGVRATDPPVERPLAVARSLPVDQDSSATATAPTSASTHATIVRVRP